MSTTRDVITTTETTLRLARVVARNSAWGMLAQLAIKLLSFGFSIAVVRRLGAETYGQYAGVLAFGAVFVFLADLGLGPFAVREIARWRDQPDGPARTAELYGNILVLRLVLSLATAVLLISVAYLTGRPTVMIGAIALGTLGLIMYGVQGISSAVLSGFERLDLAAGAQVAQQIAFVVIGSLALAFGIGYYGLIVANLVGIAILSLVCWRAVQRLGVRRGDPTPRVWPVLLRASIPFAVIGFTLGLSYKLDSVLLNIYRGDLETGYYNAAYNLVFSAAVLSNVINTALYPSLSRRGASTSGALAEVFGRILRYLMVLAVPIAVGTWAIADRLVPFLYSISYVAAIPALQIVIWVTPLMFASEFLGYVIVIRGDERRVVVSVVVSTTLNIAANLVLVPRFGLLGASVMTVVTEAILVAQYAWILRGLLRQVQWRGTFVGPIVASLLMGGVLLMMPFLSVTTAIALALPLYGGLLVAFGVVGKTEIDFLRGPRRLPIVAVSPTVVPPA